MWGKHCVFVSARTWILYSEHKIISYLMYVAIHICIVVVGLVQSINGSSGSKNPGGINFQVSFIRMHIMRSGGSSLKYLS